MSRLNWGMISNGEVFEALVQTLVAFRDPQAKLFGRQGKDYAQDARSGDGATVYQAKFHSGGKPAAVISDAQKEVEKIGRYKADGAKGEDLWTGVSRWILATNVKFGPQDHLKWTESIVPAFNSLGFTPELWDGTTLETLLVEQEAVAQTFFGRENRCFLTLPEARVALGQQEYLKEAWSTPLVGREPDYEAFKAFLSTSQRALVIHGPGGVGKTRFVIEAADRAAAESGWMPFWANLGEMSANSSWTAGLPSERLILVLIDDPDETGVLRRLIEQLATPRHADWRVVIAVRSPNDPVLGFLRDPKYRHLRAEHELRRLEHAPATSLARTLLSTGSGAYVDAIAEDVATRFQGHPIWISLAARVLRRDGITTTLPSDSEGLADFYLDEIVSHDSRYPKVAIGSVLRWLSLLRPLNVEDAAVVELITSRSDIGSLGGLGPCLQDLCDRRVTFRRGARSRLVEIKPDVIADHVLRRWLVAPDPSGKQGASTDAHALVAEIRDAWAGVGLSQLELAMLKALARMEAILRFDMPDLDLLGPLLKNLLDGGVPSEAHKRRALIEALHKVTFARPTEVIAIAQLLRRTNASPSSVESLFGSKIQAHNSVLRDLPWLLFEVSHYLDQPQQQRDLLLELVALTGEEDRIQSQGGRPYNDGKRARELIGRVLAGGSEFRVDFRLAGFEISKAILSSSPLNDISAIQACVGPLLSIESMQVFSPSDATVTWRTSVLRPGSTEWRQRTELKNRIVSLLSAPDVAEDAKKVLWEVLATGQSSVSRNLPIGGHTEANIVMRNDLAETLRWTRDFVRATPPPIALMKAARAIWDWYFEYGKEKDAELWEIANECEAEFRRNDLVAEFEPLLKWRAHQESQSTKADVLLSENSAHAIRDFVARASRYLKDANEIWRLNGVARGIGKQAETNTEAQNFILFGLEESKTGNAALTSFARVSARGWLEAVRESSPEKTADHLRMLLRHLVASDIVGLIRHAYGQFTEPTADEIQVVLSHEDKFRETGELLTFVVILGNHAAKHFCLVKDAISRIVGMLTVDEMPRAFDHLMSSIDLASKRQLPTELGLWLLNQVVRLPRIEDLGNTPFYHLRETLKKTGRPRVDWLLGVVKQRIAEDEKGTAQDYSVLPGHERLSGFVDEISGTDGENGIVDEMIGLVNRRDMVSYHLPLYLNDIDPHGRLVPQLVAKRLRALHGKIDEVVRLARLAGVYSDASAAWRTIAHAACDALGAASTEADQRRVFSALASDPRPQTYSSAVGEVPEKYRSDLRHAEQLLNNETDPLLKPFREWAVRVAKYELDREIEAAKEERGE